MVDHIVTVSGGTGQMMIRDTGWSVEFWIKAGNTTAFHYDMPWSGTVNGVGVGGTFRYEAGGVWRQIAGWNVSYNQTVTFSKGASGSTGLGGATTMSAWIPRSTIPPAPKSLGVSNVGHTTLTYKFQSQGDGGAPILEWQVGWGTSSSSPQNYVSSNGTTNFSGLNLGKKYYFWSRGRNQHGWSGWSSRSDATTLAGVWIKIAGVWKQAVAYVKVAGVWKEAIPFVKVSGSWKDAR